jgi:hypothetical protein
MARHILERDRAGMGITESTQPENATSEHRPEKHLSGKLDKEMEVESQKEMEVA